MREISTVDHLADLVVQAVLAETADAAAITDVIERANPFGNHARGRQIWGDALIRNGIRKTEESTASH